MARRCSQLPLALPPTWGGRRRGAGRKPTPGQKTGVPHRTRPPHVATQPVHATLRTTSAIRCLRSSRAFPAVLRAMTAASRGGFRIIHFSIQDDHVHLLVEADSRERLSGGLRGVAIRIARAVNRAFGRAAAIVIPPGAFPPPRTRERFRRRWGDHPFRRAARIACTSSSGTPASIGSSERKAPLASVTVSLYVRR